MRLSLNVADVAIRAIRLRHCEFDAQSMFGTTTASLWMPHQVQWNGDDFLQCRKLINT